MTLMTHIYICLYVRLGSWDEEEKIHVLDVLEEIHSLNPALFSKVKTTLSTPSSQQESRNNVYE